MQGTAGNAGVIAREPVNTARGIVSLPFLSGNALRHRCIREPGMLWLVEQYGLRGNLTLEQLNFLLHGGNLTKSTARENTQRIAEMKRTWPLLRLLGASLPDQILAGSMDVWRGTLVCEENRAYLTAVLSSTPCEFPAAQLLHAERFIGEYQYTRSDAAKLGIAKAEPRALDEKSNLMIISGQCVSRSAVWHHGFVIKHVSEIELGALLWSLRLWQASGGTIGGMAAKGHGRLACEIVGAPDIAAQDQERLCCDYVAYARDVRDDAVAWLNEAWG